MNVNPQGFAEAMSCLWQNKFNNHTTAALKQSWYQQAETYNAFIMVQKGFQLLQPPTGSGKTRGLELYCSMLPKDSHPGVLIVTRLREEANTIALNINEHTGNPRTAVAFHAKADIPTDALSAYPILVITHEAYKIYLETGRPSHGVWVGGKRQLVVIDESLAIIEHKVVHLDEIRAARGQIPHHVAEKAPQEIAQLDRIILSMEGFSKTFGGKSRLILPREWGAANHNDTDLKNIQRNMRSLPLDHIMLGKNDAEDRSYLGEAFCDTVKTALEITRNWCWYARKGNYFTFSTASVIIPAEKMNAVVLDATASCNPIYGLLGDAVHIIAAPKNIRSYANVNLHVSTGHKVGKSFLEERAKVEVPRVLGELAGVIPKTGSLFICAHKTVTPHLGGYDGLPPYTIGHWYATDGRNDWHECDTAFIYGLPFLDLIAPEITLRAIENWRGETYFADDREEVIYDLGIGHLTTLLVQAINRVRCRHVIDAKGNCDRTDIFLLLPDKARSQDILAGIKTQMPGINVLPWESSAAKRKVRRLKHEQTLIGFLAVAQRGRYMVQDVKKELCIKDTTFERLLKKAKDAASDLCRELRAIGVSLHAHGDGQGGRGNGSWFEKVDMA